MSTVVFQLFFYAKDRVVDHVCPVFCDSTGRDMEWNVPPSGKHGTHSPLEKGGDWGLDIKGGAFSSPSSQLPPLTTLQSSPITKTWVRSECQLLAKEILYSPEREI